MLEGKIVTLFEDEGKTKAILPRTTFSAVTGKNGLSIQGELDKKQDTLTAGDNITIENNVISATGGDLSKYRTSADQDTIDNAIKNRITTIENKESTWDSKADTSYVDTAVGKKQDTLVSGTNIKTLNSESLLGSGDIVLTKSSIGLGNVDNTSDANKPISTATQSALDKKQDIISDLDTIRSQASAAATKTEVTTLSKQVSTNTENITKKQDTISDLDTIRSGASKGATAIQEVKTINSTSLVGTGDITIDKSSLGLGNVDNTSDTDKPISTATQTALNNKQATLVSGTNIATVNGQSLLQSTDILSNVDNTADLDKPISTLTQNALDNKQNTLVSGTNIKTINGDSIVGSGNLSVGSEKRKCSYATPRWLRFNPSNKRGLIIKAGTSILLANGTYKTYAVDTAVDLTNYLGSAGANYNVYLANDGTITAYTSTQSNKGVKIGRFSTLCANVGTITMKIPAKASSGLASGGTILVKQYSSEDSDFYNFYNKSISAVTVQTYYDVISCVHPLNGYVAGDILPESVFCLSFFPTNKYEDGQVYDQDTGSVIDIYLQSGNGDSTRSIYNATHQVSRQAINHQEDMRIVGKRLLTDHEFTSAAIGSNEGTNITGSSDKTTVGGHVDIAIASRRMISAIGCEEMCGYIWQWLDEIGPVGGSDWATYDGHATFGKTYGTSYVVVAGGSWSNGSYCGSRSRWCNDSRSATYASNGGRGSSRIQIGI